jgi:hypothetical protein
MKQVSFIFPLFCGIVVCSMGFEVQTPLVFIFMGTDIHLSFGISFGSCQFGHWYWLYIFDIQYTFFSAVPERVSEDEFNTGNIPVI